ncbi:MAG: 30S ribosomal protein S16 [Candidatus Pacebacteria bacterium]|nr:30S ribosomal protein S16 [Candidatus Paceibacterota bacterium]MDR3583100.1 30S ribosomal protein S16 [Candidatus Paceibacterota bacterium]
MLTIRFARVGKKNKAQFKIMLQEKTAAPGGRHVEILGAHDPHLKKTVLKEDRIKYWLEKGAQTSDTVHNLLVAKGVISDKKRAVKLPAKKVEEVVAETTAPAEKSAEIVSETPKEELKTEEAKAEAPKEEVKEEVKTEEPKVEETKAE